MSLVTWSPAIGITAVWRIGASFYFVWLENNINCANPKDGLAGDLWAIHGGGTTDIAIFTEGAIRHTAVIPIAGDQVTNDIAMALRTPTQYAEEIKIRYACALARHGGPTERNHHFS